jgi:EamA-like transporter family
VARVAVRAGRGAARRLGAKLASFAGVAEVLFAILFAWLLLGQLPSGVQFLGGAFILAGVTLVRVDELRPVAAPATRLTQPQAPGPGQAPGPPQAFGPGQASAAELAGRA